MTIEERMRTDLTETAAAIVVPAGSMGEVMAEARRRSTRNRALIAAAAVVSVVLVISVLPNDTDPAPVVGAESTTSSTTPEATTTAPDTTVAPSTTESSVPDDVTSLVATPDGVVIFDGFDVVDRIELGPVMLVLADGRGGVVFQVGQSASSIMRLDAGKTEEIVPAGPGITLTLHEVVEIDGSPTVVYTARRSGPGLAPEEVTEDLRLFDLETGEDITLGRLGGYESTALRVSYAAGRFVASMTAEGYTWFQVVAGADGGFVSPRTEDQAAEDFLVWVGHGVQAPDGSTMAFMRGSPRSEASFEFVVVDSSTGAELATVPIEGAHETTIRRLEWDGTTGVISLDQGGAVVVRDGSVLGRLSVAGVAG